MASFITPILSSLATPTGLGLIGSGVGALIENLFGRSKKRSRLTPGQERIREQIEMGLQGQGPFADIFGPVQSGQLADLFEQTIGAPARRRFEETTLPQLTGQFRGAGLGQSASLARTLGRSARDLEEGLAAQMQSFLAGQQGQRRASASSIINQLLGQQEQENVVSQPFTEFFSASAPSFLADLLSGSSGAVKQQQEPIQIEIPDQGNIGGPVVASTATTRAQRPSLEAY